MEPDRDLIRRVLDVADVKQHEMFTTLKWNDGRLLVFDTKNFDYQFYRNILKEKDTCVNLEILDVLHFWKLQIKRLTKLSWY